MATTNHYKSNIRDIFFNLFEANETHKKILGHGPFAQLDEATVRDLLAGVERVAREQIAPTSPPAITAA